MDKSLPSNMRKVLVTGAKGQLGSRLMECTDSGLHVVALDRAALDVTAPESIAHALHEHTPDVVVNAAAYTAVDRAEEEAEQAHRVNAMGAGNMARACAERGVDLVHISTDYVFDGEATRPYRPTDPPHPVSVYGASKLAGEAAIADAYASAKASWWVIRVAWLCDIRGQNFMQTMVRLGRAGKDLKVVNDQHGTPTFARPFAEDLMHWVQGSVRIPSGIFHYSHLGETTWHGFAQAIFDFHGLEVNLTACLTAEYPTAAKRPAYSCLDGSEFARWSGKKQEHWEQVLASELARGEQQN